jgi:hypothetical protein
VEPLSGDLVDAVHVDRRDRMALVDRQVQRSAVDLPCAGEEDLHRRVLVPARFEDRQLAAHVDLEIGVRVEHRVEMARLTGEVEQVVLVSHEEAQAVLVADIRDVDVHAVLDAGHVVEQAAVLGDQRVDQHDARTHRHQLPREVRTDEPEPAGDQDTLSFERRREIGPDHPSRPSRMGTSSRILTA